MTSRNVARAAAIVTLSAMLAIGGQAGAQADAEIKRRLIRESIASYSGSCPCPYNRDRAGRLCGRRSAYSRPGGYAPLCYAHDVTPAMVRAARGR